MRDEKLNKKFSISKITDNPRRSVIVKDSKYEFNAPKFLDFSKPDGKLNKQ